MENYLCLTSIATLLLGLHLVGPKLVDASIPANLPTTASLGQSLVGKNINISKAIESIDGYAIAFQPPDKVGPRISRSAGTR